MKKQYRCVVDTWPTSCLDVYHDGKLIHSQRYYFDNLDEVTDKLEAEGYTYGYTKEEVEEAKKKYEKMLKNIIEEG